jgi:predicted RNase H-like nuclease (RuvC/YqgF family)
MPGNRSETQPTMTYPSNEQHARWKREAEAMDMSLSEFIQAMTEAGLKKFDLDVQPDESVSDLRRQRNDLKRELDRSRERVAKLEEQLQTRERERIKSFVADNPGVELGDIIQDLIETTSDRAPQQVADLVAVGELHQQDGAYYPNDEIQ